MDDDALSQSFDSAIIEDDQTENTLDESDYDEGSDSRGRSNVGSIDYDPEIEGLEFSNITNIGSRN